MSMCCYEPERAGWEIWNGPGSNQLLLAVTGPRRGQELFWVSDYECEEGTSSTTGKNRGLIRQTGNAPSSTSLPLPPKRSKIGAHFLQPR